MVPPSFERQVKVICPELEKTQFELLFRSMSGTDGLSELFEYRVELLSTSPNVPMEKVLGYPMTLSLELPLPVKTPPAQRFCNGYVSSFHFIGLEGEFAVYGAVLRPQMWLLTRNQDCRIWEDKSVLDVVKSVFDGYGFQCDTQTFITAERGEDYKRREYCVQYNETDFNFVSRLLEEEGIHYFFEHLDGKHKVILADSLMGHVPTEGYETIPFSLPDRRTDRDVEAITSWSVHQSVEADHCGVGDFDFTDPRLEKVSGFGTSQVDRKHPRAGHFERYQYPEPIVKMTGYGAKMAEALAKVRAQEIHAQWELIEGTCNARGLTVGAGFGISGHPREEYNKPGFLMVHAEFNLHSGDYRSSADATKALTYSCNFRAINAQNTFRPRRITSKPFIPGPQSAIVIGPSGAPTHTDKFGRVKVAFPWTRPETKGKPSPSCWVRVSQVWAGQGWGSMQIPHVGHEVLVSFLDGDPDRPIVTGRVYNGQNSPWQKLPDHDTRSYISDQVGNRIVMQSKEDEKGISLHTPSLDTHLWVGKMDSIGLPDERQGFVQQASQPMINHGVTLSRDAATSEGGIYGSTDGDIVLRSNGDRLDVAKGNHYVFVEGNVVSATKGDESSWTDGFSFKGHVGAKTTFHAGNKSDATLGTSLGVTVGIKTDLVYGANIAMSRGKKVEWRKEEAYDMAKKKFTAADREIRQQVFDLVPPQILDRPYLGGFFQPKELKKLIGAIKPDESPKAETVLTPEHVLIRCGETTVRLTKEGDIFIMSPSRKGKVVINSQEVQTNADKSFVVKGKTADINTKSFRAASNLEVKK